MTTLPPRQQLFIAAYLKHLNATQAAIEAGYAKKTAQVTGAKLLSKAMVRQQIDAALEARKERLNLDGDLYLGILHDLCTYDISRCLDAKGNFRPLKDWPERERRAIAGVESIIKNAKAGDGHLDEVLKARFADRSRNVELMLTHLGLLVTRSEKGKPGEFDRLTIDEKRAKAAELAAELRLVKKTA